MSKDLEKEYKALVSGDIPDLWARIESGLDDKNVYNRDIDNREVYGKKFNNKKVINFRVWTTVAAACLCVVLIIPIMAIHMRGGESKTASPQDNNSFDGMAYDSKPADRSMAEAYENSLDTAADNGGEAGGMKNEVTADVNASAATNAEDEGVDMEAENIDNVAGTFDMFEAEVEILRVDLHMNMLVVYTAKILNSDNSDLEEGSEIEIIAYYAMNFKQLEKDGTYTLKLQPNRFDEEDYGEKQSYLIVEYE